MRTLPLLAALLCTGLAGAQTAAPVQPHPLVASWSWSLPGKSCTESLQYRPGGTRQGSSGGQTSLARYEVSPLPGLTGFYRLTETVTESNGQADCAGDPPGAIGEPVTRFIQFSPRHDQLIVCREESLKACFGPLRRTPG